MNETNGRTITKGLNTVNGLKEMHMLHEMLISIQKIKIADRIRQENGSIDALAQDIQKHGLLNPITVMEQTDGTFTLIAGLRRLKAVQQNGDSQIRATVMSAMEADELLMLEISENEQRKDFTTAERLAFAERIKAVETEKGKQRMLSGKAQGDPVGVRPQGVETGKVRHIIAEKVGFTSDRQMRRAKKIAEKRPDLLESVDKGKSTIYGAYQQMLEEEHGKSGEVISTLTTAKDEASVENHKSVKESDFVREKEVDVPFYTPYRPSTEPAPGNVRTLKGADHIHLLENPIYSHLYDSYNEAVQQINLARGELRTRCEGYERRIRGYEENIQAMQREIERLREGYHA